MKTGTVLSVDDSEDDQLLLQRAWKKYAPSLDLRIVCDGDSAIGYLSGSDIYSSRDEYPMPDIVLLDLKMARKNGFEVLNWMKGRLPTERTPVAIYTSSQNTADIKRAYELGARWYLAKPVEYAELVRWVQLIDRWFQNPEENDLSRSPHYRIV